MTWGEQLPGFGEGARRGAPGAGGSLEARASLVPIPRGFSTGRETADKRISPKAAATGEAVRTGFPTGTRASGRRVFS